MTIRPGDMVRLAGEPPLHAIVIATSREAGYGLRSTVARRGHLIVEPLNGKLSRRNVRTGDVTTHWRRMRAR
jgi:hypothetical protein